MGRKLSMKSVTGFKLTIFLIILSGFRLNITAQMEDLIRRYAGENAEGYVEPIITGLGANLNSGIFISSKVPVSGFHIIFSLNGMLTIYSDKQKRFIGKTNGYFFPPQEVETSTIIGNPQGPVVVSPSGTEFVFPGGYDLKSFLIGIPTLTIGSLYGTEMAVRYVSFKISDDIGRLSMFGTGGRHSISQYFSTSPVDISGGVFYHKFKVGDIIKSDMWIIHLETGKSFSFIDLYSGLGYESNIAKVEYTYVSTFETADISVDVTGKNNFRLTLGIGFKIFPYQFNIDYNIGYQNVIHAGFSVGF
jgi:hypothetical protein